MRNILKYLKKYILLNSILFIIIFAIICLLLATFDVQFRIWVYIFIVIISVIGIILGIIQLIFKIKRKWLKIFLTIIFILSLVLISPICFLLFSFWYTPEYVVNKYGEKRVAQVNGFLQTYVYYYDYKNPLMISKNKRIEEYYGKGGFDPIKSKFGNEYEVKSITYYDKKGNKVENLEGTTFVDLSKLRKEKKENYNYNDVKEILDEIKINYSKYYSNISYNKYSLMIEFSKVQEKMINEEKRKRVNDIIDVFLSNEKSKEDDYNIIMTDDGRISIINTKYYKYDDLNEDIVYLRLDGNIDAGRENIENFFNSSDLEGKILKIKYNYNMFIKIEYISFISYEEIEKNKEALTNMGYYKITIDGEDNGKYYYPDYELKQIEKENKITLVMQNNKNEKDNVFICEWNTM